LARLHFFACGGRSPAAEGGNKQMCAMCDGKNAEGEKCGGVKI